MSTSSGCLFSETWPAVNHVGMRKVEQNIVVKFRFTLQEYHYKIDAVDTQVSLNMGVESNFLRSLKLRWVAKAIKLGTLNALTMTSCPVGSQVLGSS